MSVAMANDDISLSHFLEDVQHDFEPNIIYATKVARALRMIRPTYEERKGSIFWFSRDNTDFYEDGSKYNNVRLTLIAMALTMPEDMM